MTLTVHVRNAQRCTFKGQRVAFSALSVMRTIPCRAGWATVRLPLSANPYKQNMTIHYSISAYGPDGRVAHRSAVVLEAAHATPIPQPTPSPPAPATAVPLQINGGSLPGATVGVPYSATLTVTGGTPTYTWSIISGALPPGLTLTANGSLIGTPTTTGQATDTVEVVDSGSPAQSATASLTLAVAPAQTPPTTIAAPTRYSQNWSGYVMDGGPFTAVKGTFNVPNLYATSTSADASEWVGIDGDGPANPSVFQAGVDEEYNPTTNRVVTYAWFESYPAPPVAIPVVVTPGDQITVRIVQISAGSWVIGLTDTTTGKTYSIQQSYTGAATSAEWIVEAPYNTQTQSVETLGYFSSNVTFSDLGVNGTQGPLTRDVLVQNGIPVSVPSDLTPAGFTVAYGDVTPQPPG